MVAHLVRLRLTLLANTFRKSVWQAIGFILGALYALFVVSMAVIGAVAGGGVDAVVAGQVIIVVGALVVLAWWLVPVFAFGVDATLDPQRFVTFGIPRRSLLAGLAAAGLTSIPGAATLLAGAGVALAWWRTPLVLPFALLGSALAVALCVVGSRALTTALVPLLDSRRSREVLTVAALVPIVMIGPMISTVAQRFDGGTIDAEEVRAALASIGGVLAWTPFGAPWAIPAAVHDGAWLLALARLAVAVVALGVAWRVWDVTLARSLVTPPTSTARGGKAKGLGWFDRVPSTSTGAVTARCLTYWFRDPRYSASIAIIPLLPIVLAVAGGGIGGGEGGSRLLLVLAPLTGWILGFVISADIAYDHTAFALHVATGVSGRADRTGRVVALSVLSVPVLAIFLVGSLAVSGRWDLAPMLVGLTAGLFGITAGVSSVTSARLIYPAVKPGDSPLRQPQGAVLPTMIAQGIGFAAVVVLALPVIVTAILTIAVSPVFGWVTLLLGLAWGVAVCLLGIRYGGRWYDRRTPELLQQVVAQD
ncbi:hypothetical protein [Ruania albidiflava]|uniref:hypothetical protein n=1 Tax=Ruania albidiflava TaxID=366586 RepID=UPI0003B5141A|nr:hypothetical protein [Ruania albidiflava]